MVSPDTMNSSMRTIHGPTCEPARRRRARRSAALGLGPDLEVVVEHRGLAVEQEAGVRRVGFEQVEQVVEQVHEPQAERLERRVPLAVPVRVGDDADRGRRGVRIRAERSYVAADPAVADAGLGDDEARAGGVVAELAAQLARRRPAGSCSPCRTRGPRPRAAGTPG